MISDRIEAAHIAIAAAMTNGDLTLHRSKGIILVRC